jgi:hypothetical protein
MKLDRNTQIFFGCKIDSKLREALAMAKPSDRRYFEDPESGFLRILTMERKDQRADKRDERWIGKMVKAGLTCTDVEDIQRNVVSILRRIAPDVRTNPNSVKIFVVDENAVVAEPEEPATSSGGSGPYIEY